MNIFFFFFFFVGGGGMEILWIFFGGHHKIGLYFGVILCIFGSFLKVEVKNGGDFWGC